MVETGRTGRNNNLSERGNEDPRLTGSIWSTTALLIRITP
jgi:hypothetical protein